MSETNIFRSIPSVDSILRTDCIQALKGEYSHATVSRWAREAINELRDHLRKCSNFVEDEYVEFITRKVRQKEQIFLGSKIRPVLNATGIILHTNLGRAPLADEAVNRVIEATQAINVELDLFTGHRNHRGQSCVELLQQLTGCEDAILVNNCAAATMMVLQVLAAEREVVISRGQLVEIGGGFRLPDVFRAAGATLREVGTTNRTYVRDYEAALNAQTAAIMRVHHSNYRLSGFVHEPTIAELAPFGDGKNVVIIDDLGSGWLGGVTLNKKDDEENLKQVSEPSVIDSVASNADLTLFSGDKLLGGPQCGIILGKRHWVNRLRDSPLMRAMRLDKMSLAALEATLEIHNQGRAAQNLPVMQMLLQSQESIRERCVQVISRLPASGRYELVPAESQIGGGSMPDQRLESFGIRICSGHPNRLAARLRQQTPAIHARVTENSVVLDLRTVRAEHDDLLVDCVENAVSAEGLKSEKA